MKATDTNLDAEKARIENELVRTAADHDQRMAALRAKKAEIDEAVLVQTREKAIAAKGAHAKRQIELVHAMCADEEIRLAAIERASRLVLMAVIGFSFFLIDMCSSCCERECVRFRTFFVRARR